MNDLAILFVEDEDGTRESLVEFIKTFSSNVFVARNGQEGLDLYLKNNIELVISDIKMPVISGIEMVRQIKKITPQPYIIFTTAHSDSEYMVEAIDMQVDGYLLKPIDFDKLEDKINNIMEIRRIRHELSIHQISHPGINLKETMFATLGKNQNILYANDEFLSFFNIKNIDEFYFKNKLFSSIFVKESGCFYPRENESWVNDFRRIKKNERSFIALFDEVNDRIQIVIGHIYDMSDGINVGVSLKKVDYLDKTNNENILLECISLADKENLKKLLKTQLEENEDSSIKIITTTVNSEKIEVLSELSMSLSSNIRHIDSLERYYTNNFSFIIRNVSSENVLKLVDRLKNKIFNSHIKGEIKVIDIDSKEAIERAFI